MAEGRGIVMKKRKLSFTSVGGSSILTIFAVLCFIVFALLSLSTAKANHKLSVKSVSAVSDYYKADTKAEEILGKIRMGQLPKGVKKKGKTYCYSCPLNDSQRLSVEVQVEDADHYKIKKWKKEYCGEWKPDDTIEVWDGMEELLDD